MTLRTTLRTIPQTGGGLRHYVWACIPRLSLSLGLEHVQKAMMTGKLKSVSLSTWLWLWLGGFSCFHMKFSSADLNNLHDLLLLIALLSCTLTPLQALYDTSYKFLEVSSAWPDQRSCGEGSLYRTAGHRAFSVYFNRMAAQATSWSVIVSRQKTCQSCTTATSIA